MCHTCCAAQTETALPEWECGLGKSRLGQVCQRTEAANLAERLLNEAIEPLCGWKDNVRGYTAAEVVRFVDER